ncbi:MAG: hypothetical protein FWF00_07175 [Endomicrobia bacterium]|nr:hypothetical protein [Endomicrobiia bacterium]MCL2507448.1 hypothetical protein [Endomicrobiia bacterium]
MKKNIIVLTFFAFLAVGGIFYFLTGLLSNNKESDLENLTVEKARAVVNFNIGTINKAIEESDDLALLHAIESIAKVENISSCFILDKNNKVIIHNNTNDWNSVKKDSTYDRAINYDGELTQIMTDGNSMLFSSHLVKDYTLCCVFSIQKAQDDSRFWRIKYFTIAAGTLFLITAIFYFLAKLFIVWPFARMKKSLEKHTAEEIKKDAYNEITDIFATERDKYGKTIKTLQTDNESLAKIIEYSYMSGEQYQAFIILNASDNIVFAYDKTEKFLKKGFETGKHIVESSLNPKIIEIVNTAAENPGKETELVIDSHKITAVSVHSQGTIIKII